MRKLFVLFSLILIYSCSLVKVYYDYEKSFDFELYKTYNYYSDLDTGLNELDHNRLLNKFDDIMKEKGFELSSSPDFYVSISSQEVEKVGNTGVGVAVGGTSGNVGGGVNIGVPVGPRYARQMFFEFIDEDGIGLFWQAISESPLDEYATPNERRYEINKLVEKVLEGYPPQQED